MLDWLTQPIDLSRAHEVGPYLSWHARFMVVAWSFLVPFGILFARFFKIWPGETWPKRLDDQRWWVLHRVMQYTAATLTLLALILIWMSPRMGVISGPHAFIGWTVIALLAVQVFSGLLRGTKGGPTDTELRGDHFDMTLRRLIFEYVHKFAGYVALGCAIAASLTGLWQTNAPMWMWVTLLPWWVALVVAFGLLQHRVGAIDTYQAIWGDDPTYPGNRKKPIGFGIRQMRKGPGE
jgi:hypothetical protein